MSKLFSLLKATMSGGIQVFNYRGKTKRSRRIVPILLAVIIGTMMLFSATAMTMGLKEDGAESAILSLYTLVTTVVILMEGIYKSGDLLFKPRDNDALLAMPINKSTIILARIIKFYVFEMLYCLIFLLPAIIAYAISTEVTASYYLVAITMLLFVPIIPIAISCIVGLVTSLISARSKRKTLIQVILSFVALFAIVIVTLKLNTEPGFGGRSIIAVSNRISEFYYPASVFVKLTAHFELWQYLLFIIINLAVLVVTVAIIGKFYFRIVTRIGIVKRAENINSKYGFHAHSQVFAIIKKELTKYFSTPVLIMNTAIGLVLFLVAVGAFCFKYDDIVAMLTSSVENFPLSGEEVWFYTPSIAFVLIAFTSLMTFITATMISLEGKAFNLLKSMPISGRKVIMSKVLAALLLIVPVTIAGGVVTAIRFQFGLLDTFLILIAAVIMPLIAELIGILINLRYARFDAESDAVAVKQSASVMVATFMGLGMVLTVIPITIAIVFLAGQSVGLAIIDATFAVIAMFLCFVVATRGEEKYSQLVA